MQTCSKIDPKLIQNGSKTMLWMLSAPNPAEVGFRALNPVRGTPTWGTFLTEHVAQGLFLERPLGSKVAPKNELLMLGRHLEPQKTASWNGFRKNNNFDEKYMGKLAQNSRSFDIQIIESPVGFGTCKTLIFAIRLQ